MPVQIKGLLPLTAQVGLPPFMLDVVKTIPVGKSIAGATAERREPVTICNLRTDTSGAAKPGAKIVGALGIRTHRPCKYTAEETQSLEKIGRILGSAQTS